MYRRFSSFIQGAFFILGAYMIHGLQEGEIESK